MAICGACMFMRRECCPSDCVFARYFQGENPGSFPELHAAYNTEFLSRIFHRIHPIHFEATVYSLILEADCRRNEPVSGCAGEIDSLRDKVRELNFALADARRNLTQNKSPQAESQITANQLSQKLDELLKDWGSMKQQITGLVKGSEQMQKQLTELLRNSCDKGGSGTYIGVHADIDNY